VGNLSVAKLINTLQDPLGLQWFHGEAQRAELPFAGQPTDIAALYNPLSASPIHLVNRTAFDALHGDQPPHYPADHLFAAPCALVIYCEGLVPPDTVKAQAADTAVVLSDLHACEVLQEVRDGLARQHAQRLNLIVDLKQFDAEHLSDIDRLEGKRRVCDFLGVDITEITLPVAPGRNLAVLVEAAVRNYLLMVKGEYAAEDLQERQRLMMRDEG